MGNLSIEMWILIFISIFVIIAFGYWSLGYMYRKGYEKGYDHGEEDGFTSGFRGGADTILLSWKGWIKNEFGQDVEIEGLDEVMDDLTKEMGDD